MRCLFIILALAAVAVQASPDKLNRLGRRGGRRGNAGRGGRQLDTGYGAPEEAAPAAYGAPEEVIDLRAEETEEILEYEEPLDTYAEEPLETYEAEAPLETYENDLESDASALDEKSADSGLDMLMKSVPGVPGEDYPILAEAPETEFSCEGQVNGGYYADPEAECQVFHICSDDGQGGMTKYSFLCPNGTIFNQGYFICDWWFNVDCSEAEALAESRNAEIAGARAAVDEAAAAAGDLEAAASTGYGAPVEAVEEYDDYEAVIESRESAVGYGAPGGTDEYVDY